MWNSASTSSDLAKGKKFLEKLQYVQHVDQEKKTASELSELTLQVLLADGKVCHDSNSTENVGNPESNFGILKSSLKEKITYVSVCSNPLPIRIGSSSRVAFHAFVVFTTRNTTNSENEMFWSLEKNGKYIVLQQSENEDDVAKKLYDAEKGQSVERYGEVKFQKWTMGNLRPLEDLLRVIWETNQISDPYHLLYSNCQNFASFIFEKSNGQNEKWSTDLSAAVDRFSGKKKKTAIEVKAVNYKFNFYKAMMEGRRKDFEELTNDLTMESLNSIDSQGYTLLEWATVFSTYNWPINEELKKKGAQIPSDEGSFRRNLFFIALQYLPSTKKSKYLAFDGIDMNGVNKTKDTSLHLALYGEKWELAEEILNRFENYDVNSTNSLGETPLHLAAKLNCKKGLFKKILNRTNSKKVNKVDGNGCTALHYAIENKFKTKVEELVNHKDVDVNIQNTEDYYTALHLASMWPNIPADLFQMILEKSNDINTQDIYGSTALHLAIFHKSKTVVKELLNHKDVDVNANNDKILPLHLACIFENVPMDLFNLILEKSDDINAQDKRGWTALHWAILTKSENKVKELLKHEKVDVNVNYNLTVLHLASLWTKIPFNLFDIILKRSTSDTINARTENGRDTALTWAILLKCKTHVEQLLKHKDVDVNVKNKDHETALSYASEWKDIPEDLFKLILEKSEDIIA
jgi:ankyrin repeat protein